MNAEDVVITGIGLVSSLGEGAETHWRALTAAAFAPVVDSTSFPSHSFHPLPELDWAAQIAKRSDQRQMELWQRLGTYTAGLALDDAGAKGNAELLADTDMIIAAGGGERDEAVDEAILAASQTRDDSDLLLNEKLTTELRPTLFLAQLSNLLAGNISIVHNVTGSSRTFMGEDSAGVSAISVAASRIAAGQSRVTLVGGAFQCNYRSMALGHALGGHLHEGAWKPVWQRSGADGGGIVPGSGSAFLVLEALDHARARGARPYARLERIVSSRIRRGGQGLAAEVGGLFDRAASADDKLLVISGASGAPDATGAERAALAQRPSWAFRAAPSTVGHLLEAQFPFAIALAALALHNGQAYPPFDDSEPVYAGVPESALATSIGYISGEGVAVLRRMD